MNDFKPWQKDSTIYLVAGQGGGIRAAYWTYLVLDQLEKDIPNFKNKLMGTSTVSGSSLGSACFWLRKINKNETKEVLHPFWSNSDLLTPVIGYFLFNDMVQRFLPFPIDSWDRGKAFEAGVEMEWDKYQKEFIGLMSKGFIQNAQHLPPIFFNSTHVETGQKCIISNVNLEQSPYNQYFEIAKKDIPWSAALSLSARFPMITPAGTVYENDNHIWGHINDGGYHENSGIETIRFIYQKIKKSHPELKVKVIYLKNGQDASHNRSSKGLHELKSVTGSFYNSWSILPDNLIEAFAFDLQAQNDTLITIALPRSSDDQLPLGWFLSSKSKQIIQNELKELVASDAWKQVK